MKNTRRNPHEFMCWLDNTSLAASFVIKVATASKNCYEDTARSFFRAEHNYQQFNSLLLHSVIRAWWNATDARLFILAAPGSNRVSELPRSLPKDTIFAGAVLRKQCFLEELRFTFEAMQKEVLDKWFRQFSLSHILVPLNSDEEVDSGSDSEDVPFLSIQNTVKALLVIKAPPSPPLSP